MSAVRVPAANGSAAVRPSTRPRPRLISSKVRPQVSYLAFAGIMLGVLALGMFGVLLVQTRVQAQGFQQADLDYQAASLREREASLRTQLDSVSSSGELIRRASRMGMVPAGSAAYLDLRTGKVTGQATPAGKADLKTLRTRDQQIAEAKAKADAETKARAETAAKALAERRAAADRAAAAAAAAVTSANQSSAAPSAPVPSSTTSARGR